MSGESYIGVPPLELLHAWLANGGATHRRASLTSEVVSLWDDSRNVSEYGQFPVGHSTIGPARRTGAAIIDALEQATQPDNAPPAEKVEQK